MSTLPLQVSPYYSALLNKLAAYTATHQKCDDEELYAEASNGFVALNRQVTPSKAEDHIEECELSDPLGAENYLKTPRLVHQYKNRCLLLSTAHCFSYCRFCFRRNYAGQGESFISADELKEVCSYLRQHPELKEILISGGDPMTANNQKLLWLFSEIRKARPGILIRLCTRAVVFSPERFTNETILLLKKFKPLWVIPHINHPIEISKKWSLESFTLLHKLVENGIPVQSQTVLLAGINDNVETLTKLFETLSRIGVKPGYLFQTDLAKGTSHFRVPLQKGKELYSELAKELSGLSLPKYAVDLPGGGGKVNIMATNFVQNGDNWVFTDENGKDWTYPV